MALQLQHCGEVFTIQIPLGANVAFSVTVFSAMVTIILTLLHSEWPKLCFDCNRVKQNMLNVTPMHIKQNMYVSDFFRDDQYYKLMDRTESTPNKA